MTAMPTEIQVTENNQGRRIPAVVLIGAGGRMGRVIAGRFLADGKVALVAAVDPACAGQSVGTVSGSGDRGPGIVASIADLPQDVRAEVAIDFSTVQAVRQGIETCLKRGWDTVIGVTGFDQQDFDLFDRLSREHRRRVLVVPNFTIGVNLLLKMAGLAAPFFRHVEIIEMHHDRKVDAPSGTAVHTAKKMASVRPQVPPPSHEHSSRGQIVDNIPVHSVRLQGLLAHQEVIFGNEGEVLTIRHDTTERSAFLSGIYLAIDKIQTLPEGLTVGLEWALGGTDDASR